MLLHTEELAPDGPRPARWIAFLHGIYGRGGNWRRIARGLIGERSDWGAVLVDLRMHGRSQGAQPPHTVAAAAADVLETRAALADRSRIDALCGHSFGGKIALIARAQTPEPFAHTFVLDSSPSARPDAMEDPHNTVVQVLHLLERSRDRRFESTTEFAKYVEQEGFPRSLGAWLAMNLERDGVYRLGIDPAAMRALLADYFATDAWAQLDVAHGGWSVVAAGQGSSLSSSDRERMRDRADDSGGRGHFHELPEASHWLHVDHPDELISILLRDLPAS